ADCGADAAGPSVVLIADDLTGAADSGVTFAEHGAKVMVVWDAGHRPAADVVVISTESRHSAADEAAQRVTEVMAALAEGFRSVRPPWIYKKIDSTLRGHPGVELATVLRCLRAASSATGTGSGEGLPRALVAPAFPAQGRVTRGGIHTVHGIPLAETVFGQTMTTSRVYDFFAGAFDPGVVAEIPLASETAAEARVFAADAATDEDLTRLVNAALENGTRVFCGSAGLAGALAARLAAMHGWTARSEPAIQPCPVCSAVLLVIASRNPQTRRQLQALAAMGIPSITPPVRWFLDEAFEAGVPAVLGDAVATGAAALTTSGLPELSVEGATLAARLGSAVAALLTARRAAWEPLPPAPGSSGGDPEPMGLVMTGGDAAIAVSSALGAQALHLCGEVAAGMPWGRLVGGAGDGVPVVTKAGGFGQEDALLKAVSFLRGGCCD
ncbi:MAG: four-carbon acid sugar kinase family protein, partial [Anaerolineae bacterium]|nr:four-carbon acid sugar kinase family protein [Anaerolineae bacterium]